jgi:hypothetical protein
MGVVKRNEVSVEDWVYWWEGHTDIIQVSVNFNGVVRKIIQVKFDRNRRVC